MRLPGLEPGPTRTINPGALPGELQPREPPAPADLAGPRDLGGRGLPSPVQVTGFRARAWLAPGVVSRPRRARWVSPGFTTIATGCSLAVTAARTPASRTPPVHGRGVAVTSRGHRPPAQPGRADAARTAGDCHPLADSPGLEPGAGCSRPGHDSPTGTRAFSLETLAELRWYRPRCVRTGSWDSRGVWGAETIRSARSGSANVTRAVPPFVPAVCEGTRTPASIGVTPGLFRVHQSRPVRGGLAPPGAPPARARRKLDNPGGVIGTRQAVRYRDRSGAFQPDCTGHAWLWPGQPPYCLPPPGPLGDPSGGPGVSHAASGGDRENVSRCRRGLSTPDRTRFERLGGWLRSVVDRRCL